MPCRRHAKLCIIHAALRSACRQYILAPIPSAALPSSGSRNHLKADTRLHSSSPFCDNKSKVVLGYKEPRCTPTTSPLGIQRCNGRGKSAKTADQKTAPGQALLLVIVDIHIKRDDVVLYFFWQALVGIGRMLLLHSECIELPLLALLEIAVIVWHAVPGQAFGWFPLATKH
jgi:hypothetical protein